MKHLEQLDPGIAEGGRNWELGCLAAQLLARSRTALGGIVVHAAHGPVLEAWLNGISQLYADRPIVKLPPHVSDERLSGGLDLTETLRTGAPCYANSILASADKGLLILPSADRLDHRKAALIAACIDAGGMTVPNTKGQTWKQAKFDVIAIDESEPDENGVASCLADRLALHVTLNGIRSPQSASGPDFPSSPVGGLGCEATNRAVIGQQDCETICRVGSQLGISSQRALMFASRAAQFNAALHGRVHVEESDLEVAVSLVLAARATQVPAEPQEETEDCQPEPETQEAERTESTDGLQHGEEQIERLVDTARAVLPSGLLDGVQTFRKAAPRPSFGRAGVQQKNRHRGARIGTLRGKPERGAQLALHATLLAAAPFQPLLRKLPIRQGVNAKTRLTVLPSHLRVYRRSSKSETLTIFAVDASGSSALHRLAEVKGAVELLLAECYVRRDQIGLIAFRKTSADLLLPPTSAVARARRCLAQLPGGGGTPLAKALEMSLQLAHQARRQGTEAHIVLLTDGRANIDREGKPGRKQAMSDAMKLAERFRSDEVQALLIDTAPMANPQSAELAAAMQARYMALPKANAHVIREAVGFLR